LRQILLSENTENIMFLTENESWGWQGQITWDRRTRQTLSWDYSGTRKNTIEKSETEMEAAARNQESSGL